MSFKRTLIASALMLSTMLCVQYLSQSEDIFPAKPLSTFPKRIGQWIGKEEGFSQEIYEALGVDDSFFATYNSPVGRSINLYVGFYQSQREGDLIHSPKHCMPGAGWNITHRSSEEIEIPDSEYGKINAIKLTIKNGSQQQIVLYWFQSRGRFIASEYMQKIYLIIDSITKRRTDGSFIRLMTPIDDGDQEKAIENLKNFSSLLIPVLQEFIPS